MGDKTFLYLVEENRSPVSEARSMGGEVADIIAVKMIGVPLESINQFND